MYKDEIVDEVRKARTDYAAKFGFDAHKIYMDMMKREKTLKGVKIVPPPKILSRKSRISVN